jgi:hypothetical protein
MIRLSAEDELWIEAIVQRAIKTRNHYNAYSEPEYYIRRQASLEVERFYYLQLTYYGWIERESEAQLRTKRLAYEAETERLRQERIEADIEAKRQWFERRDRRLATAAELQPLFDAAGGRDRWIHQQRRAGRSVDDIVNQLGYAWTTIHNIASHENESSRRRYRARMEILKRRPLDMGGPRDVWLTYYPPPDPRLDNMEPAERGANL